MRNGRPARASEMTRRQLLLGAGAAAAVALAPRLALAQAKGKGGPKADQDFPPGPPIIDCHSHLQVNLASGGFDWDGGLKVALAHMDKLGIKRLLVQPPPQPPGFGGAYDLELGPAVKRTASRFGFLAGGGSLNPFINRRRGDKTVSDATLAEFDALAARIAGAGASGLGELAVEHFSGFPGHPYVSTPADHPLFLRLADIAAQRGLPVDIHMEAVPADMDIPADFARRSSANPARVSGNIEPFERLLAHNRGARIVWVHLGWDVTGFRTPALTRELLRRNENLVMQVRPLPPNPGTPLSNFVLTPSLTPEPEWTSVMAEFPDRFVIGADNFYVSPRTDPKVRFAPPLPFARPFVNGLPPDLGAKVGHENATRIYRLPA